MGMLHHKDGNFIWKGEFVEKEIPKGAGFLWNPTDKVWWTKKAVIAQKLVLYADEECLKAFAEIDKKIEMSRATEASVEIPVPNGLSYFPFQKAGIEYAINIGGNCLIADAMGLGKTIQALGFINAREDIHSVLVLCPATLKLNWYNEAKKWLVKNWVYDIPTKRINSTANFVIVNYDRVSSSLKDNLLARKWDLLICDESHYLKNPNAQRTKTVLGKVQRFEGNWQKTPHIAEKCKYKLFLTGTPILNRPKEIFSILNCLSPERWGNKSTFEKRYCNGHLERIWGSKQVWNADGASNLEELQAELRSSCMIRRQKCDVLKELPPKTRQIINIDPPADIQQFTEEEWVNYCEEHLSESRVSLLLATTDEEYAKASEKINEQTMLLFTELSTIRHQTALAKVPFIIEHLNTMLESGIDKIVVFAHHRDVIENIAKEFKGICVTLTGEDSIESRQNAVDNFQANKAVKIFIGSIKAAGMGITLTEASNVVFAELDWTPANISQAEDRCHRIGQEKNVLIQHIIFNNTIDAHIVSKLVEKQKIIDDSLDKNTWEKVSILSSSNDYKSYNHKNYERFSISESDKLILLNAIKHIMSTCDGAKEKDSIGFSKFDVMLGRALARLDTLLDKSVYCAAKLVVKYHKQLPEETIYCAENILRSLGEG